ncbi:PREDICTED: uncharacterized protein LOC103332038 [Prunus mume]|uniref:Uncharacterized protein LOC103332038 n=1 Tax=Prunus mume TaxID=102107 RepID=A0ABM0P189_PRUMU|nr:PREDICTED: uncharacterized protein LOC103332038 [Prunus mume]
MTISSLLQNPFEMITSPSSSSSLVNLLRLHQQEVRFHAMKAAEVEESSNKQGNGPFLEERVHSRPINRPSSPAFMSPNASRLYSVAVTNGTNSTTSLSPERVFLSSIPVNGLSREDAIAASSAFRLNMDLHSSNSSHQLVGFCFLPPPELADMNYTAKGIPDLNLPPPDVSASELVLIIKNRNIFHFINAVCSLVVKQEGLEGLAEYMKNKSSLTELQLCNLYSIRIWNMLSLSRGGEIEKELVEEGLIEALIRVEDLPSPLELVLAPPHHCKAPVKQDTRIDYKQASSTWFDDNKETLSSDARNYDVVDDEEEDQGSGNYDVDEEESSGDEADHHQDQKRKAVAVMDDQDPYDQHLQRKKGRHGGALRIDEPANP